MPRSLQSIGRKNEKSKKTVLMKIIDAMLKKGYCTSSVAMRAADIGFGRSMRILDIFSELGILLPNNEDYKMTLNAQTKEKILNILESNMEKLEALGEKLYSE